MCISAAAARFSDTVIYSAEVLHPEGSLRHVIGYQNSAHNYGPNAMLLPFPAEGKVGPDNLVNGTKFKGILKSYEKAVGRLKPVSKSARRSRGDDLLGAGPAGSSFQVFESGSYTIVLAEKASGLGLGLQQVPAERRPKLTVPFLIGLSQLYPDWPIALCCFEGSMTEPEPLFWHYRPRFPDVLFAPAIDAHDGTPPKLDTMVARDHTIAFASHASLRTYDEFLVRDIQHQVPAEHRWLFDAHVCGGEVKRPTNNGDFVVATSTVRNKDTSAWFDHIPVASPPQDRPDQWDRLLKDPVV